MLALAGLRRVGVKGDRGRQSRIYHIVGQIPLHDFVSECRGVDFPGLWFKYHERIQSCRNILLAEEPVAQFDQVFCFVQFKDGLWFLAPFTSPCPAVSFVHHRDARKFFKSHIKQ